MTYVANTTCDDAVDLDCYPGSDEYVFEKLIFPCEDTRVFAHEHMVQPRNRDSYTTTQWRWSKNIWDTIAESQARGPMPSPKGARWRVSYRCHAIRWFRPRDKTNVIYFDVDNRQQHKFQREVEVLKTIPHAIWCRSPSGGFHVFVLVNPINVIPQKRLDEAQFVDDGGLIIDPDGARDRLSNWLRHHRIKPQVNVLGLSSTMVPGQDPWTQPCAPGDWDTPIAFSYEETISLFAHHWWKHRAFFDDIFGVDTSAPVVPRIQVAAPRSTSQPPRRNRPRLGQRCNIPGITGSISVNRKHGTFTYETVQDCHKEGNGYNISCALGCALLREHEGNRHEAEIEFLSLREKLRTPASGKHDGTSVGYRRLRSHTKQLFNWAERTYDPDAIKDHSDRKQTDLDALADVLAIAPKHFVKAIQKKIAKQKKMVIDSYSRKFYIILQSIIPDLVSDLFRNAGRLATRSKKARDEYYHSDTRCLVDLPGIGGNRRLLSRIRNCLMYHLNILVPSEEHDWSKAKCTRYSFSDHIIAAAREMTNESRTNGTGTVDGDFSFPKEKENLPSTNLGAHTAVAPWYEGTPSPCSDPDFYQELANIKGDWNWVTD